MQGMARRGSGLCAHRVDQGSAVAAMGCDGGGSSGSEMAHGRGGSGTDAGHGRAQGSMFGMYGDVWPPSPLFIKPLHD